MPKSEKKSYPFWHVSPNILILGAGASKAAFPDGDKLGRKLPLMNDLVEILDLGDKLTKHGIDHKDENFEKIYDNLYNTKSHPNLLKYIENSVW
ncbi:MAG: hypothetical protein WD512_08875, partial [Candidatus Paceibacterota bacterium]